MLNGFTCTSVSPVFAKCSCLFSQKAKPLSLEESFKLLQDQEKRQKVGTYVTIGPGLSFQLRL